MSYYVRNISAEMATVLRRMATTLIRLREKLELQTFRVAGIWILIHFIYTKLAGSRGLEFHLHTHFRGFCEDASITILKCK